MVFLRWSGTSAYLSVSPLVSRPNLLRSARPVGVPLSLAVCVPSRASASSLKVLLMPSWSNFSFDVFLGRRRAVLYAFLRMVSACSLSALVVTWYGREYVTRLTIRLLTSLRVSSSFIPYLFWETLLIMRPTCSAALLSRLMVWLHFRLPCSHMPRILIMFFSGMLSPSRSPPVSLALGACRP